MKCPYCEKEGEPEAIKYAFLDFYTRISVISVTSRMQI